MKKIIIGILFTSIAACAPLEVNYSGDDYGYVATAIVATNDAAQDSTYKIKLKDAINDWNYEFPGTFVWTNHNPIDLKEKNIQAQIYTRRMKVSEYSATEWEASKYKDGKSYKAKGQLMKPFSFKVEQGKVTYLDPVIFAKIKLDSNKEAIAGMHFEMTSKIKKLAQSQIKLLENERIEALK